MHSHVLIFEPQCSGHHGPYLEWMAIGLLNQGHRITIVTLPKMTEHPVIKMLMNRAERESALEVVVGTPPVPEPDQWNRATHNLIAKELAYWRLFRSWYDSCAQDFKPDVVFLPYADYCLNAIGLRGSPFRGRPWACVSMRPSFHYQDVGVIAPKPALSRIKRQLFFNVLRNRYLKSLFVIDEPLFEYVSRRRRYADKIKLLSEPAEFSNMPSREQAKRTLGLCPQRKTILIYGAISARKGFRELLQAVAHPQCAQHVDVLVAGRMSSGACEVLESPDNSNLTADGRVHVLDRFIETNEEATLFAAVDMVWLGYSRHYNSSGVLQQAAAANRPVIACREGIIGWHTEKHERGVTVDPADAGEVALAIKRLAAGVSENTCINQPEPWQPATFTEAVAGLSECL